MFLVHETGLIAIDPLPTLGPRYLDAIASVTKKPITHVIYSHEHTDHIGAAHLFPASATFIAHRDTAELLIARKDARRPVPTDRFDDSYTLEIGGQRLVLDYRGLNHSRGNVFIYAPRQRVLMLVDVVYPGFMPYKNLGIAEDVQGYVEAHRQALAQRVRKGAGGALHGPPAAALEGSAHRCRDVPARQLLDDDRSANRLPAGAFLNEGPALRRASLGVAGNSRGTHARRGALGCGTESSDRYGGAGADS